MCSSDSMLLKKGIRRCWMNGPKPLVLGGERIVGPAFTLRFVPVREDLATPESWASPISTRAAIEDMPEGVVAVADAMSVPSAGIFGDILCARMKKRKVAALVTDVLCAIVLACWRARFQCGVPVLPRRHPSMA